MSNFLKMTCPPNVGSGDMLEFSWTKGVLYLYFVAIDLVVFPVITSFQVVSR
jgi:hypothetical protein